MQSPDHVGWFGYPGTNLNLRILQNFPILNLLMHKNIRRKIRTKVSIFVPTLFSGFDFRQLREAICVAMFGVFTGSAHGRDTGRYRDTPADGAGGDFGCASGRPCRARGVDCRDCEAGRIPARRALLLSSCYFGKKADRRFAALTPSLESVRRFRLACGAAKSSPVILVFNRGEYPRRVCGHRGKPWIFRKPRFMCAAAESSGEGLGRAYRRGFGRRFSRAEKPCSGSSSY